MANEQVTPCVGFGQDDFGFDAPVIRTTPINMPAMLAATRFIIDGSDWTKINDETLRYFGNI